MSHFPHYQNEASLQPPGANYRTSFSSDGRSSYEIDIPHYDLARIFNVYNTTSHTNWTVTDTNKTPLYYVRTSSFRPGRPDITVHADGNREGRTLAVADFPNFSSKSKLGLGDPDSSSNVVWEDLKNTSKDHSEYQFEMLLGPNNMTGSAPRRKLFSWKRTHSVGVGDSKPMKLSMLNFKLTDVETGDLVAVWAHNSVGSFKKKGKIQINRDYGREFDLMIFLSISAIIERAQRRKARRNAAAAGDGGD